MAHRYIILLFLLLSKDLQVTSETDIERNCFRYQGCIENHIQYCYPHMDKRPLTKMDVFCEALEGQFCLAMTQVWYTRQVSPSILNTSTDPKPVPDYSFPALGLFAIQLDEMCSKMKEQMSMCMCLFLESFLHNLILIFHVFFHFRPWKRSHF